MTVFRRILRTTGTVIAAMAIALLVVGCVDDQGLPPDCDAASVTREVTLTAAQLSPNGIEACRDQELTLTVTVEVDGVLHIHGYDDGAPATSVRAGEELTLEFVTVRSGQFPIELHPADNPTGIGVGILTVHEP